MTGLAPASPRPELHSAHAAVPGQLSWPQLPVAGFLHPTGPEAEVLSFFGCLALGRVQGKPILSFPHPHGVLPWPGVLLCQGTHTASSDLVCVVTET